LREEFLPDLVKYNHLLIEDVPIPDYDVFNIDYPLLNPGGA